MSRAAEQARARAVTDKPVPAYPAPTAPANITTEPIGRGKAATLSPVSPLKVARENEGAAHEQSE